MTSVPSSASLLKGRAIYGYDSVNSVYRPQIVTESGATRSVISAENDSGQPVALTADTQGHLEVAVHGPLSPIGSVLVDQATPWTSFDAIYGINSKLALTTSATGGSVSYINNLIACKTGTSVGGFGVVQSRKRIPYNTGQGTVVDFSAAFTTGVANSAQIAGFGTAESGIYFGYNGASFGIWLVNGGVRAVVTMTITVASTHSENVTVRLNGVDFTVAVTNSGNIQRTVWEIAQGNYSPGWTASPSGATIIFVQGAAGSITIGNFSLTATSAAATFASTVTGVTATTNFTQQSDWSADSLDGTGPSGVTIHPTNLNNYRINVAYTGNVSYYVQIAPAGANNTTYSRVHDEILFNGSGNSAFRQPSGPLTASAVSQGSTTDLTVTTAIMSGFINGIRSYTGNRFNWGRELTSTVTTTIYPVFTLHNSRFFKTKANQKTAVIVGINAAVKHTQPCTIYFIRSVDSAITLTGNPNFVQFDTDSILWKDNSSTAVTVTANSQYVYWQNLSETSSASYQFRDDEIVSIQPGEYLSVCASTKSGTANTVSVAIIWREL